MSDGFCFWFDIEWSPWVIAGTPLSFKHPDFVHINVLEFVVLLLQLAAAICCLEAPVPPGLHDCWGAELPAFTVFLALTNNMSARKWDRRVSSSGSWAQALVQMFLLLIKQTNSCFDVDWISGKKNMDANFILRPKPNHNSPCFCPVLLVSRRYIGKFHCSGLGIFSV